MKNLLLRKSSKYGVAIIAIAIVTYLLFFNKGEQQKYVLAEATMGDITQVVSATGSVTADPTIDMNFQKSGTVKEILIKEGENVGKNKVLATLKNDSLELEIERNKANIDYAYAQYNQTKAGAKYEEILIAKANVDSAQAAYNASVIETNNTRNVSNSNIKLAKIAYKQAETDRDSALEEFNTTKDLLENEIAKLELGGDSNTQTIALDSTYSEAQTKLDALITIMHESMFLAGDTIGIRGTGYTLLSTSKKNRLKLDYYNPANEKYEKAMTTYDTLPLIPTKEDLDNIFTSSVNTANDILIMLTQIGTELENLPYSRTDLETLIQQTTAKSSSLSNNILVLKKAQTTILNIKTGSTQNIETLKLNYKLQITGKETKYKTTENTLSKMAFNLEQAKVNAETSIENATAMKALKKAALDSAIASLALRKSPARSVDLAPLLANISKAEIALKIANNNYKDSQLIAPIDGIITFIYGKLGENVSTNSSSPFLSIQSDKLIVEANIPETDIVKIKQGDKVEMTIDALDFTEKLQGSVVYMDPAETIVQGVVYYQIKTAFDLTDERLKSGMTTNLDIITDEKKNVLVIPTRAIKYENNTRYVDVLINGAPKKATIGTGLESDQYVEITSGLKKGDKIITFVK